MKKNLLLTTLFVMTSLAFVGCGKKDAPGENIGQPAAEAVAAAKDDTTPAIPAEAKDDTKDAEQNPGVTLVSEAEKIVFSVPAKYKLESDAWLGIVPEGKVYLSERDADDDDIYYVYSENYNDENRTDYKFFYDKNSIQNIDDGQYNLILCSSDDESVGKVLFQIQIHIKDNMITL